MSRSLLKKALMFYNQEENIVKDAPQEKQTTRLPEPIKRRKTIGERKREAKKNKLKLRNSVQDIKIKYILNDVIREKNADNTRKNLRLLQRISGLETPVLRKNGMDKIVEHTRGRLSKDSRIEKPKKQIKSVFTDKDFEEFERTYFVK